MWCVAWWHSGRDDDDDDDEIGGTDVSSRTAHPGCEETLTPVSAETPFTDGQTLDGISASTQLTSEHQDYRRSQTSSQLSKDASGDKVIFFFLF